MNLPSLNFRTTFSLFCLAGALFSLSVAQVENVPVNNQVYEFFDRMGVKGILPLYSNAVVPFSRRRAADLLRAVDAERERLNEAEKGYLEKFKREFMHETDPSRESADILFHDGSVKSFYSDNEKYLYSYADSALSLYAEFVGAFEFRNVSGDTYGNTSASFEQHGGRVRGTIGNSLGYFLQATNGTFFGNKGFALSDPRLRGNVKFKDLNSPYFDYTEAYLRAGLGRFGVQFGREYTLIGAGYGGRILLSDIAPVFDFIKFDFQYKSLEFVFIQGSLVDESSVISDMNKYLALHRVKFSLFNLMNVGISEMIVYRRFAPDFAYLNPVNFYKSSEHSLRDRDNAFLNFDLELYPVRNYKFYGTWLIDDIDFKKMGTGWWGNGFGWQSGAYIADLAGIENLDGVVEYTRIEPYVYSNRIEGNDYSSNGIGLGHHLQPNSDEWFVQLSYRPGRKLRTWLEWRGSRHGENISIDDVLVKNVGGSVLEGHRETDDEYVRFLDGILIKGTRVQMRAVYEPVTNYFISGAYEIQSTKNTASGGKFVDQIGRIGFFIEY